MKNRLLIKKITISAVLFYALSSGLFSQDLPSPPWLISSDYGPRNNPGYDWHWGIDYDGELGDPIQAVEGGTIADILINAPGGAGNVIRIDGTRGSWFYLHTFEYPLSSDAPYTQNCELREARLEDPQEIEEDKTEFVIIFWSNRSGYEAEKVLAKNDFNDWHIFLPDLNTYVLDNLGNRKTCHASVNQSEEIAIIGTSGGVGSHLDIRLKSTHAGFTVPYDVNPLYHLIHDAPSYTVSLQKPAEGAFVYRGKELIKATVNSTSGLDVDGMDFYLNIPGENYRDIAHRINTDRTAPPVKGEINYGGRPDVNPYPDRIINDGNENRGSETQTGINPVGITPGNDEFFYVDFNSKIKPDYSGNAAINDEAKYKDGRYTLTGVARSITRNAEGEHITFEDSRNITLDNFAPYVKKLSVFQNNQRRYNSSWEHESGEMNLSPEGEERQTGDIKAGELITIRAEFSEEVTEVTVQVEDSFVPMAPVPDTGIWI